MILDENNDFYIIEMSCRLGTDMIPVECGQIGCINFIELGFNNAIGFDSLEKKHKDKADYRIAYSYMISARKAGVVTRICGLKELELQGMDVLINLCEGDCISECAKVIVFVGFIANSRKEVCEKVDMINKNLRIDDENGENMILEYMTSERFERENRL